MTLAQRIAAAADDDAALAHVVDHFAADSGTLHFMAADERLHLAAHSSAMPEVVLEKIRVIPVGKGMAGLAVERRAPVDACNIQTDTSGDVRPGARRTGMAGAIVVPILRADQVVGTLGIANRAERTFTDGEIEELMEAGRAFAHRRMSAR